MGWLAFARIAMRRPLAMAAVVVTVWAAKRASASACLQNRRRSACAAVACASHREITMKNEVRKFDVVTVTLNPAIDRTVTIRNFTAGAVNRVEQERSIPGGKGVNVPTALADYGHQVAVTGFLGRENSAPFEDLFARKKIEDRFVRIAGRTRVGIKITDPALHQTADINFPGPPPAPSALTHSVSSSLRSTAHGSSSRAASRLA